MAGSDDTKSIRYEGPLAPGEAIAAARALGRRVVTFSGFSAAGYERPKLILHLVQDLLAERSPRDFVVNCGATEAGIGQVYGIAKRSGFTTMGVVSSLALDQGERFSSEVDHIFVVRDESWGGRLSGGSLSPTSQVMVQVSDEYVALGGGAIARDEYLAAHDLGRTVKFFSAEMNHRIAVEKARARGTPIPSDFRGELELTLTAHRS